MFTEVLNNHKRHPALRWQRLEKRLECVKATGRRAQRDNWKTIIFTFMVFSLIRHFSFLSEVHSRILL